MTGPLPFAALTERVLRRPGFTFAALALLSLAALAGLPSLRVDFSAAAFFGGDDPERLALAEHRAAWGPDDDRLLVLVAAEGEADLLAPGPLEALAALTARLGEDPDLLEVRSLLDLKRLRRPMPGVVLPVGLLEGAPADPAARAAWRQGLLADPDLVPGLLSADGRAGLMILKLGVDTDSVDTIAPVVRRVQATLADFEGREGLHLVAAGLPAARTDLLEALVGDQLVFVPLAVLIIALAMAALYRSLHGVLVPLALSALPVLLLLGLMGWAGEPVGLINQVFFTLIPIIAIADAVHLVSRFHEEAEGGALRAAIPRAAGRIGAACLLTSLTTVVGLLSLNTAEMPVLRSFGTWGALGVGLAWLCLVLAGPLLLALARRAGPPEGGGLQRLDRGVEALVGLALARPRAVLAPGLAAMLLAGLAGSRVVVNNRLSGSLPEGHPTSEANALIDAALGGVLTVDIAIRGEDLRSPAAMGAMWAAARAAETVPGVSVARGPADLLASASAGLGGPRRPPDDPAALDALLRRLEAPLATTLREGEARVQVRCPDPGALDFSQRVEDIAAVSLPPLQAAGLEARLIGTPHVAYRGVNRVTEDLRESLLLAFAVIAGLITLLFRSPRLGALSLLPNAAPLLFGYGFMGLMGWELEPGAAVVFTMALGIAVDDTIHLLARFTEERRAGLDLDAAVRRAARQSGRAVTVTTLLLAVGFGVNLLSAFPANRTYGALGAIILLTALACDLLLLPALLILWGPLRAPHPRRS